MNFTTKVANLLIWFWTTYIVVALTSVKTAAINASNAVQSNLTTFQNTVNGSITSINQSVSELQSGLSAINKGTFKHDIALQSYIPVEGEVTIQTPDLSLLESGRYNLFLDENNEYLRDEDGYVEVSFPNGDTHVIDDNDEITFVYEEETGTVLSTRKIPRANVVIDEAEVQAAVAAYMTANPYQA